MRLVIKLAIDFSLYSLYLGNEIRDKTNEKKESVVGAIKKHRSEEKGISKEKNKISKEAER